LSRNNFKRIWISVFIAILILISILYTVLSNQYKPDTSSGTQTQKTLVSAPDFTVIDKNGNSVSLSDFIGRPIVLNFWASWCPPCKAEMPDYEDLYQEYSQKGVVFIMINMTDGSRETVNTATNFIADKGYSFPVYFDTLYSAAIAYNISSIPDSIFINKDGKIVSSYVGMIDADTLKSNLEKIIK